LKFRNILLVDDNPDDGEIFAIALNAVDALKALKGLERFPDMAFLGLPYALSGTGLSFAGCRAKRRGLKKFRCALFRASGAFGQECDAKVQKCVFSKKAPAYRILSLRCSFCLRRRLSNELFLL